MRLMQDQLDEWIRTRRPQWWHHVGARPVQFVADLRVAGLDADHIKHVIQIIDRTCQHCWDQGIDCSCRKITNIR